jgi:DNA-directed RNA polymerase subunit K/omega
MARITSQKAAQMYGGLFDLVLGASQRAREIRKGSPSKVKCDNGAIITALKEIEQGLYTKKDYMSSLNKSQKKKGHRDEYFTS